MRRFVSALLLLGLLLGLAGCGTPAQEGEEKLLVVASAFPSYDLVRAAAGDLVELKLLLKPGAEPHSYEPSPQDILAVEQCDLFLYGGGESDAWLDRVLSSGGSEQRRIIRLMDCAEVCPVEDGHEGHDHEHEEAYDEHVWTSPMNALRIMEAIVQQLAELDAEHADVYREMPGSGKRRSWSWTGSSAAWWRRAGESCWFSATASPSCISPGNTVWSTFRLIPAAPTPRR